MKPVLSDETIKYEGGFFEVFTVVASFGDQKETWERIRRAPGVRVIVVQDNKLLMIKEFRTEVEGHDYRIPGGKVFDRLDAFKKANDSEELLMRAAEQAGARECEEETGFIPEKLTHFTTSKCGATIDWDLIYFTANSTTEGTINRGPGEDITVHWVPIEDVKNMCLNGDIHEERTVGVLLRFLLSR